MTLKTSLFNKGIFVNNLKRFKWGSLLYFLIIFFSVPFNIMVSNYIYYDDINRNTSEFILRGEYIGIPLFMAVAVPIVASALIFRFMHSKSQGIAAHILPITRRKNYFSTLASAFCLMVLPILTNAVILFFVLLSKGFSDSYLAFYWFMINAVILFIMFSLSTVTSLLTGHTAAHIVLNIFLHFLMPVIALTIEVISDVFLYGFISGKDFIAEKLIKYTPFVYIMDEVTYYGDEYKFFTLPIIVYIICAFLLYVVGYFLYKKRKVESCGDVAAFKAFSPILKYCITTVAAIVAFAIMHSADTNALSIIIVTAIVSAVFYFAIEMLLNKTFRVFHLYKGFLSFSAACVCVTLFFAYTSVFGYETRVPDTENIEGATIFGTYKDIPALAEGKEIIDFITECHKDMVSDVPVANKNDSHILRFQYKLKNGDTLERLYNLGYDEWKKIMIKLYEFDEYKYIVSGIDALNIENVQTLELILRAGDYSYNIALNKDSTEFLEALKKDISELSYEEMEEAYSNVKLTVNKALSVYENQKHNVFKTDGYYEIKDDDIHRLRLFDFSVNPNYKNVFNFLKEKGYYDEAKDAIAENLWLVKNKFIIKDDHDKIMYERAGIFSEKEQSAIVDKQDCIKPSIEDALKIADLIFEGNAKEPVEGEYYAVFCKTNLHEGMWISERCFEFKKDELPEYLKKYISE